MPEAAARRDSRSGGPRHNEARAWGAGGRALRLLTRRPPPPSRILEAHWGSDDGLLAGQGPLQSRFLQQTKVAMVINGEFLVSVRSGPRRRPWCRAGGREAHRPRELLDGARRKGPEEGRGWSRSSPAWLGAAGPCWERRGAG